MESQTNTRIRPIVPTMKRRAAREAAREAAQEDAREATWEEDTKIAEAAMLAAEHEYLASLEPWHNSVWAAHKAAARDGYTSRPDTGSVAPASPQTMKAFSLKRATGNSPYERN